MTRRRPVQAGQTAGDSESAGGGGVRLRVLRGSGSAEPDSAEARWQQPLPRAADRDHRGTDSDWAAPGSLAPCTPCAGSESAGAVHALCRVRRSAVTAVIAGESRGGPVVTATGMTRAR